MLDNALLHSDEVRRAFHEIWYDTKYQYFYGSEYRHDFAPGNDDSECRREFVSLDKEGKVIGFMTYLIDPTFRLVTNLGVVNFGDNKVTFGRDLRQLIDDIFVKFGMNILEWSVICGNPIERSYTRLCKKMGGRVLCRRTARASLLDGTIVDDVLFEVTREQYMSSSIYRQLHPESL